MYGDFYEQSILLWGQSTQIKTEKIISECPVHKYTINL